MTRSDGETKVFCISEAIVLKKVQYFEKFNTIRNGDISWPNVITAFARNGKRLKLTQNLYLHT